MTKQGGTNGYGTVFKITPAGVETVLWSFGSGNDGREPYGSLLQGTDGNFYGMTSEGGTNNAGTVTSDLGQTAAGNWHYWDGRRANVIPAD